MPDFQPTSEVIQLSFSSDQAGLPLLIMISVTFSRTQYLPIKQGYSLTMLLAQSLLWDSNPQLWLS
jgi:hypothetical protein